jgi:DMSO reductase anchor subunit
VLSGLGYGLAAVLGLNLLDPTATATKAAHIVALALIGGGLLSSTLHLGNPQRAWRALSQWRSSWLSREGVLALLSFVPIFWSAWTCVMGGRYVSLAGALAVLLAAFTVYCTSMIYASLKSVDAWHTPLTSLCYLLFALSGGLFAASFFAMAAGSPNAASLAFLSAMANLAAWTAKWRWRQRLKTTPPRSTAQSATGLGYLGTVGLLERPHMTENYLTHEMGFSIARKHADKLFGLALIFGGLLPSLLAVIAGAIASATPLTASFLTLLATATYLLGTLVERWLFFAEARHAVMSYYGS